jgi:hypothetical protein
MWIYTKNYANAPFSFRNLRHNPFFRVQRWLYSINKCKTSNIRTTFVWLNSHKICFYRGYSVMSAKLENMSYVPKFLRNRHIMSEFSHINEVLICLWFYICLWSIIKMYTSKVLKSSKKLSFHKVSATSWT